VGLAPAPTQPAAPETPGDRLKEGHLSKILATGGKIKLADEGVTFLIEQANSATPAQLGGFLQSHHLVGSAEAAQAEGQRLVDALQSKGTGSVLLGVRAGVASFVIVDALAPGWPLARKVTIAVIITALVAAIAFFGINSEPAAPGNVVVKTGV